MIKNSKSIFIFWRILFLMASNHINILKRINSFWDSECSSIKKRLALRGLFWNFEWVFRKLLFSFFKTQTLAFEPTVI